MFAAKKLISAFVLPLPLLLALAAVGIILLFWSKRQRTAKALLTADLLLFFLLSLDPVAKALLRPLEDTYPPFLPDTTEPLSTMPDGTPTPKWIVVLGAGHIDDATLPALTRLSAPALARLGEGIRLHRLLPGSRLVLSGGLGTLSTHAQALVDAAKSLGVARDDMVLEGTSRDTDDEAHSMAPLVNKEPIVLVTSASHMRRAVGLFRAAGMKPIPAPTEHIARAPSAAGSLLRWILPDRDAFLIEERAVHEYLGIFWAKLRGRYR